MNYYKRHLGDIAKSCSDLSQGQMGAYDLLLDWHYANEKPIPLSTDKVHLIGRARTKPERDNVDSVLAELFTKTPDGYIHKRAGEEMEKAAAQAEANRQVAIHREATKRARMEHDSCTNGQPNHKPLATSQKEKKPAAPTGAALLPDLDAGLVSDFLAIRKAKRAPLTETALAGIRREAAKAGLTLEAAIRVCCERGWAAYGSEWPNNGKPTAATPAPAAGNSPAKVETPESKAEAAESFARALKEFGYAG